jgi:hypothetical protein
MSATGTARVTVTLSSAESAIQITSQRPLTHYISAYYKIKGQDGDEPSPWAYVYLATSQIKDRKLHELKIFFRVCKSVHHRAFK